ncbi:hypothetical protein BDW75DRAFT_52772 [Aspergillus navahoensis]
MLPHQKGCLVSTSIFCSLAFQVGLINFGWNGLPALIVPLLPLPQTCSRQCLDQLSLHACISSYNPLYPAFVPLVLKCSHHVIRLRIEPATVGLESFQLLRTLNNPISIVIHRLHISLCFIPGITPNAECPVLSLF